MPVIFVRKVRICSYLRVSFELQVHTSVTSELKFTIKITLHTFYTFKMYRINVEQSEAYVTTLLTYVFI